MNGGPTQFRQAFSGQADANGNLTVRNLVASQSQFAVFTLVAVCSSGAPQWVLQVAGGGPPLGFAGGGKATLGGVYTYPSENLELVVTGAAPSADIRGALYGFVADGPDGLPVLGLTGSGAAGTGGGASGALPGGQAVVKATLPAFTGTGAITQVPIAVGGAALIGVELVGTIDATTNVSLEGTVDDVNWRPVDALAVNAANALTWWLSGNGMAFSATNNYLLVAAGGLSQIRLTWQPSAAAQATTVTLALRAAPSATVPLPRGQQLAAQSQPVVIASNQSAVPVTPFSSSLGQKTMANSMPVVIASDQAAIPVTVGSYTDQNTYAIRASGLSTGALGAGGAKVILSLWHLASSGKTVRLRRLKLYPDSVSAASILLIELLYFGATTLPSGGTGIVPTAMVPGTAVAELSVQSLPATAGATETAVALAIAKLSYGIIAGSVSDLFRDGFELYKHYLPDVQPPTLRSGNQEGWNLKITSSGAATILFSLVAEFTEA